MDTSVATRPKPMTWMMSLMRLQGQLLRGRKEAGLTQDDVAARLSVGLSTFQRWEQGRSSPTADQLFRWADCVDVEISSAKKVKSDLSAVPS